MLSDDTAVDFTFLADGENNSGNEDCAQLNTWTNNNSIAHNKPYTRSGPYGR